MTALQISRLFVPVDLSRESLPRAQTSPASTARSERDTCRQARSQAIESLHCAAIIDTSNQMFSCWTFGNNICFCFLFLFVFLNRKKAVKPIGAENLLHVLQTRRQRSKALKQNQITIIIKSSKNAFERIIRNSTDFQKTRKRFDINRRAFNAHINDILLRQQKNKDVV